MQKFRPDKIENPNRSSLCVSGCMCACNQNQLHISERRSSTLFLYLSLNRSALIVSFYFSFDEKYFRSDYFRQIFGGIEKDFFPCIWIATFCWWNITFLNRIEFVQNPSFIGQIKAIRYATFLNSKSNFKYLLNKDLCT